MEQEDIEKDLNGLAEQSKGLDLSPAEFDDFFKSLANYSSDFLKDTHKGLAYKETQDKGLGIRSIPIPEKGARNPDELLEHYKKHVEDAGLNPASGGHLAYIPGGGVPVSAFGDFIAAITNRYSGVFFANPGAVRMENLLVEWMAKELGFGDCYGNLSSGGSIANLIAITAARDAHGVEAEGIRKAVIYLTEQAHHSIQKAIRICGLAPAVLRYIPVDEAFRMNSVLLEKQILKDKADGLNPFLLVSSMGTTDTGGIDPIEELDKHCKEHGLWHHIDAAYGGFFLMLEQFSYLKKTIAQVDSMTVDPHKGLFLPYGLGTVLVRNKKALKESHYYLANYMQDTLGALEEESPADYSPELTKHFRGMRMWLALQYYGTDVFRACLEEKLLLTTYFYQKVENLGFVRGPEPELSVCIYRFVPESGDANQFNMDLVEAVRIDGRVFLSSTSINGVIWLRLAVLAFRTKKATIDLCLQVLEEKVKMLQS